MLIRPDMSRLVYALTGTALVQLGFVFSFFNTDQNIYNLLSAGVGALVIRFAFPSLPWRVSVGGWFVGVALAMQFGRSVFNAHFLHPALEEHAVYGLVALTGDLVIQIIGWLIRLGSKGGRYFEENTKEAIDEGIETGGKLLTFWLKWKAPLLDAVTTLGALFSKKP